MSSTIPELAAEAAGIRRLIDEASSLANQAAILAGCLGRRLDRLDAEIDSLRRELDRDTIYADRCEGSTTDCPPLARPAP